MTLSAKTGTLSTGTGAVSSTVVVSGLGFQPKAIVFWYNGRGDVADAVGRASHFSGFGFAVSTTDRRAGCTTSLDASASSDGGSRNVVDACIISCDSTGALDGAMDLQSMDADGFTLVVDDVMPRDTLVGYLALGGDSLTNAASGNWTIPTATPGTQDITTVGFQPDVVLFYHNNLAAGLPTGSATRAAWGFGAAVSASQEACWAGAQDDSSATMDTGAYCIGSESIAIHDPANGVGLDARAEFDSFLSNGFRLNWLAVHATTAYRVNYLALKGGSYSVGSLLTQTDTTTAIVETGLGFAPAAALFCSAGRAESTAGTPTADNRLSIGAAHGASARHALAVLDENGVADSEVTTAVEFDACYANIATDSTVQGLMDIQSIDSDGFTCIMDDADPAQSFVWYLAVGNAAAGGQAQRSMHQYRQRRV